MPTAYTADLHDGNPTSFKDFLFRCARAFGALIEMRDEPLGTPLPPSFRVSDWYVRRFDEANEAMARINGMTLEEADREAEGLRERVREQRREQLVKAEAMEARYMAMLVEVEAWAPPTTGHQGLKDFMVEQLNESLKFDCGKEWTASLRAEVPLLTAEEFLKQEKEICLRDVERSARDLREARERAGNQTAWVQALVGSVGSPVVGVWSSTAC